MKISSRQFIAWSTVLVWCAIIAGLSTDHGSAKHTGQMLHLAGIPDYLVPTVNHVIRKSAHFTEYAVLGILATFALTYQSPKLYIRMGPVILTALCGLYAFSDELHQVFVPSRTASPKDVLIDTMGAVTAIICLYYLRKYRKFFA